MEDVGEHTLLTAQEALSDCLSSSLEEEVKHICAQRNKWLQPCLWERGDFFFRVCRNWTNTPVLKGTETSLLSTCHLRAKQCVVQSHIMA